MVKVNRSTGTDFLAQTALAYLLNFTAEDTFSQFEFSPPAIRMDLKGVRRVSSAGYRLPERKSGTRPVSAQPPAAERARRVKSEPASAESNPDKSDTVKQDQVWKDLVWNERRAVEEW